MLQDPAAEDSGNENVIPQELTAMLQDDASAYEDERRGAQQIFWG